MSKTVLIAASTFDPPFESSSNEERCVQKLVVPAKLFSQSPRELLGVPIDHVLFPVFAVDPPLRFQRYLMRDVGR